MKSFRPFIQFLFEFSFNNCSLTGRASSSWDCSLFTIVNHAKTLDFRQYSSPRPRLTQLVSNLRDKIIFQNAMSLDSFANVKESILEDIVFLCDTLKLFCSTCIKYRGKRTVVFDLMIELRQLWKRGIKSSGTHMLSGNAKKSYGKGASQIISRTVCNGRTRLISAVLVLQKRRI
jgi:hypothetical protein